MLMSSRVIDSLWIRSANRFPVSNALGKLPNRLYVQVTISAFLVTYRGSVMDVALTSWNGRYAIF
jgi:hypothetical protein